MKCMTVGENWVGKMNNQDFFERIGKNSKAVMNHTPQAPSQGVKINESYSGGGGLLDQIAAMGFTSQYEDIVNSDSQGVGASVSSDANIKQLTEAELDALKTMKVSEKKAKESKMPKAFVESMLSNPSDFSSLERADSDKLEERISKEYMARLNEKLNGVSSNRSTITETKEAPVTTPTIATSTASVDYTIIKAIVTECLNEKFKEFGEGALKTITLKGGKIHLIDNKGNIFEADLKAKGNINDKK